LFGDCQAVQFGGLSASVAAGTGHPVVDVICDLLLAEEFRIPFVRPSWHRRTLPAFVLHPLGRIAANAALIGTVPSAAAFGTYQRFVGDSLAEGGVIALPRAIWKTSSFPAQRLGRTDRGLRDTSASDILAFDPTTARARPTYVEPRQAPVWISHLLVFGELVIDYRAPTGARPGRLRPGNSA
jgi:N-acyl-D-amino-acid deacylase